jgi:hypothetical protein
VRIGGHAVAAGSHREVALASGEISEARFRTFLADTLGAAARLSRDGAVHFVCMDWRHMDSVSAVASTAYGERLNLCVWNKSNAGMGSLYRSKHELIFVYQVGTAPHLNMVELGMHGRNRTNVWDYASVNSMRGSRREDLSLHPTVKPTGLVADAIQDVPRHGDLVLESFLARGRRCLRPTEPGGASAGSTSIRPMSTWPSNAGRPRPVSSPALRGRRRDRQAARSFQPRLVPQRAQWQSQGRPRGSRVTMGSAFQVLVDKTLTAPDRGGTCEIPFQEDFSSGPFRTRWRGRPWPCERF